MCISPTPTEQDFVASRSKHIGVSLYIRLKDFVVVDTIRLHPADFVLCASIYLLSHDDTSSLSLTAGALADT